MLAVVITLLLVVPAGLFLGSAIRQLVLNRHRSLLNLLQSQIWVIYALGVLIFLVMAGISFRNGQLYQGLFLLLFSVVEVFCLVRYGLRRRSQGGDTAAQTGPVTPAPGEQAADSGGEVKKTGASGQE